MIAPYQEGGLKLIDSRTQCKYLKLKWINNIKEQYQSSSKDFWYVWVQEGIPKMDMIDFLKCNLSTADLNNVCKWNEKSFWYEVFLVWCEYNYMYDPHP